jgi:hypothetical protein
MAANAKVKGIEKSADSALEAVCIRAVAAEMIRSDAIVGRVSDSYGISKVFIYLFYNIKGFTLPKSIFSLTT